MANYKKRKAKQNSRRCGMCKSYKKDGNVAASAAEKFARKVKKALRDYLKP
jgi:hypothetical protein